MSDEIDHERRHFFGAAAMTVAATQFGLSSSAEAQSDKRNTLDTRIFRPGTNTSFTSLKQSLPASSISTRDDKHEVRTGHCRP
jgi:hypothetical protein